MTYLICSSIFVAVEVEEDRRFARAVAHDGVSVAFSVALRNLPSLQRR